MRRCLGHGEQGQAALELLGALPLVLVVSAGVVQALSAGLARELADHAAEAGAVALVQDADPRSAARAALPGWARDRVAVTVHGGSVRIRLRPPSHGIVKFVAGVVSAFNRKRPRSPISGSTSL